MKKFFMYLSVYLSFLGALLIGLTLYQISKHPLPCTPEEFKQFVLGCAFFFTFVGASGLASEMNNSTSTGKIINCIYFIALLLFGLTSFFLWIFHL